MIVIDIRACESPIEAALGEALVFALAHYTTNKNTVELHAQYEIGGRRADFALWCVSADGVRLGALVVEADGAAFHDAKADAQRDAELLAEGWPTQRYTGSAIHANPHACAADAVQWLAWYARPRAVRAEAAE